MRIFDNKITHFTTPNFSKEQLEEFLFPPEKENEIRNLIEESAKHIFPQPNDDVEFIIPSFNTQKHYKHLKKQIWRFSHK